MTFETILLETDDRGISTLTINRPDKLNALSHQVLAEIDRAVDQMVAGGETRGLILTGAGGKAFVAGADIAWMSKIGPTEAEHFSRLGQVAFTKLEEAPFPVIAAVDGFALGGGCELAMACDFIIAGDKSRFGQPEAKLGLVPGFMGSQRLPRLVGAARAKELLFSARMVEAEEALRIGLVTQVVPRGEALETATQKMVEILGNGPVAVRACKRLVNEGMDVDRLTGGSLEASAFGLAFATKDHDEGIDAFLNKREPAFKDE